MHQPTEGGISVELTFLSIDAKTNRNELIPAGRLSPEALTMLFLHYITASIHIHPTALIQMLEYPFFVEGV